jgi:hypothetical protein
VYSAAVFPFKLPTVVVEVEVEVEEEVEVHLTFQIYACMYLSHQ